LGRKPKVAITDAEYESHEIEERVLSRINAELVKFQCGTEDEVIRHCSDADGLLNQYAPITRKVMENLKNVKVIARYGVGVDNLDTKAATEKGIFVANVIYDITDVADHTVGLILSLIRKIPWIHGTTRIGEWDWRKFQPIPRLKGKTVGIIGFGRIGRKVAQRLKAFDVELIVYDPYLPPEVFENHNVTRVDFETILKSSDIITIHVPLTEETRYMLGANELEEMKRGAFLVNVSRGGIIDEKALCSTLRDGRIAGAALDVLEERLTRGNPLLELSNVIITPHIAWYSTSSIAEIQEKAAKEVARALSGQIPINLVNKEVLGKMR